MDWNGALTIILRIAISIGVVVVAYFMTLWIFRAIDSYAKKAERPLKEPNTVLLMIRIVIYALAIVIIISIFSESLLPALTGLGLSTLVLGLAVREPISNFICGILVLLTRTIKEGDVIEVSGYTGSVEVIDINHTKIKTFDGRKVLIPNRIVWNGNITKFWPGTIRRVDMVVGASYSCDIGEVLGLIREALEEEPLIHKAEGVNNVANFRGFGSSSLDFTVMYWVERPLWFEAQNAFAIRLQKKFAEHGIEIPFTQIDLHVKREEKK